MAKKKNQEEILISRMYSGKYLKDNIGHEIINLFRADDGDHYVYICDDGKYGKGHKIKEILLVGNSLGNYTYEVLGWATGLEAIYNPNDDQKSTEEKQNKIGESVSYGGASLAEIFATAKQQEVLVTFKAEKVRTPEEPLYIRFTPPKGKCEKAAEFGTQLKAHIRDQRTYIAEDSEDHKTIKEMLASCNNWNDLQKMSSDYDYSDDTTYLDICGRSYDEVAYSNAIGYMMEVHPELAGFWFGDGYKVDKDIMVKREWSPKGEKTKRGRADLFIYSEKNKSACVIENKLLANLGNFEDNDGPHSQLEIYEDYMKNFAEEHKPLKNCHHILLLPDYHPLKDQELKDNWTVKFYSQFRDYVLKHIINHRDPFYKEFIKTLKRHTTPKNDGEKNDMMRKFAIRIATQSGKL